ncbi:RHS repeat domain-containing protein, partial [Chryseobacterium elymi]|uniref:RHS repeat domain-containing protein n=1 Tax=Chryseobacterium elymi TaxID=395936 RepID=UPI0019310D70
KLFGYELKYFNPQNTTQGSTGKYNGNITEVTSKTATDQVLRQYNYQYDGLNRLKKGIYSEPGASVPQNGFFNETLAYDLNGNITSLQRNGKSSSGTAQLIDNLTYNYTGNKLNTVTDTSGNYSGYPDTSGNTISYDDNGNMKDHVDKGVLQIDYNFLNLPDYIKFDKGLPTREGIINENIYYTYRADGTKLRKIYNYTPFDPFGTATSLESTVTEYVDGFQYEIMNGKKGKTVALKFVPTAEGYYNFENNKYIYSYTDHLGNVRLSYSKNLSGSAEALEENNYYPFGLKHEGYNVLAGNSSYTYGYNGKELQKETGWGDYGARMYMADIGRWGVIDPLAEQMRRYSPYNYAFNNPVSFIDPDGMKPHQFSMPGDSRPDANTGSGERNWLSLGTGNTGGIESGGYGGGNGYSVLSSLGNSNDYLLDNIIAGWAARGIDAKISKNGYLSYWTLGAAGYESTSQEMVAHMLNLSRGSVFDKIDFPKTTSNTTWWVNAAVGAAATANIPRSGFFKYNELWHQTKTRGISYAWEGKWKNPGAKYWRGQQVKGFQGARSLGTKLTAAGGVLLVADVAMSGELKPSHAINGAMLLASTTGIGSIVAGVWFVADMGTMGVNYLINREAKGLGDMIDESVANEYGKFEMYDGLY